MKASFLRALAGLLFCAFIPAAQSQSLITLHSFPVYDGGTNLDGSSPKGGVVLSGNTLYGTTYSGGSGGVGTVFAINTNGTVLTTVYNFTPADSYTAFANTDGANPDAGLVISDGMLYGTALYGGSFTYGTVFAVNTNGNEFAALHDFTGQGQAGQGDFGGPQAGVTLSGDTVYGTTAGNIYTTTGESTSGYGTIFGVNIAGTGFTNLHAFSTTSPAYPSGFGVNADGAFPYGALVLSNNVAYGTASAGGQFGNGAIFAVNTDGSGFTNLYSFTDTFAGESPNSDGAVPMAGLALANGVLYGTTTLGGSFGHGTIFAINIDGSGFTNLHNFSEQPSAGLAMSSNTLYGTTESGGAYDEGSVFAINTNGTGFTTLYSFGSRFFGDTNGASPSGGLVLYSNTLYGTTSAGGSYGGGTVYSISLSGPPEPVYYMITACVQVDGFLTSNQWGAVSGGGPVAAGTAETVAAMANPGYVFAYWEDLGTGQIVSASTNYTFTVTNDVILVAYFGTPIQSTALITVQANPGNGGTVSGGGTYAVGSSQEISAQPKSGWTFAGWSDGNEQNPRTITVPAGGATYTADFTAAPCTYTLSATSVTLAAKGGSKNVSVKVKGANCPWTAVSNDPFITITSGSSGTASGKVDYTVPGNTNTSQRSGTMTIAGQTFTVNQDAGGCTFKLSPAAGKLKATGGAATVKVTPNLGDCDWIAVSNDPFITITGGASGTGKGTVTYSVPANTNTTAVTGSITIGGETFTVTQSGVK
ncbi:MAG TPA: choice-of-anchor tandem repeat GloVer-containing protein [Verrucomicrobiae bacterium]|nr:choice-of-anchor tandem repeat GloVer-containing protein [Verrucomicrobiae bacterium]